MSIPADQKKTFQEVFNFYDMDSDGKLSKEEFDGAIKTLGCFIPKNEMEEYLNKTSILDYSHFEELAASKLSGSTNKNDIIAAFGFLDPKGTGKAKAADIRKAFTTIGEPLKDAEINGLLNDCTENGMTDIKKFITSLMGK